MSNSSCPEGDPLTLDIYVLSLRLARTAWASYSVPVPQIAEMAPTELGCSTVTLSLK